MRLPSIRHSIPDELSHPATRAASGVCKVAENAGSRQKFVGQISRFLSVFVILGLTTAPGSFALANTGNATTQTEPPPIPNAMQFPIVFTARVDSSHAIDGDKVEAKLKEDLVVDDEIIAPAGSLILGHIERLRKSRRFTESMLSSHGRFHKGSSMKIAFDEIITDEEEHIKIIGCLSKQTISFIQGNQPRNVEIGANGELKKAEEVFTSEQMVASNVVNFAASTGLNELGAVASMGALPVVMGVIGATNPGIVSPKPMGKDEKHPRIKGFGYGVFSTLPAAPVLGAVVFKGSEIKIEPGDEFLAQAHSPYENTVQVLSISSKIIKKDAPATTSGASKRTAASVSAAPPTGVTTTTTSVSAVPLNSVKKTNAAGSAAVAGAQQKPAEVKPATNSGSSGNGGNGNPM